MTTLSELRAMYVGQPSTERADRWSSFLTEQLASLRVESLADLGDLRFDGVDIVFVDGEVYTDPAPPRELRAADLPLPTVLIAGVGGQVSDAIGLKLGWDYGCLCLDPQAILMDTTFQHPIFRGPVPVPAADTRVVPPSDEFLLWTATKTVPEQLTIADIHTPVDADKAGLVSTSAGFLDSPDCEPILAGINSKAHDYNAVARQGRFLQWGFYGDPTTLTGLAKALFLNSVAYIATHAGAPVEGLRVQYPRDMLQMVLGLLDHPQAGDPHERLAMEFGSKIPDGIGATTESALAWFEENRGTLRHVGVRSDGYYTVDDDVVDLGLANDAPEFPDALALLLDRPGTDGDRGRRLWKRYLGREPRDAEAERNWLTKHRDRMFFSDWAGYLWIARDDLPDLTIPRAGTADAGPAWTWLTARRVGEELEVSFHATLPPGHYIYGPDATDGVPVSIEVVSEHAMVDDPTFPAAEKSHLYGRVRVPIKVRGESDTVELAVRLQVCNEQSCGLPQTVQLQATAGSSAD